MILRLNYTTKWYEFKLIFVRYIIFMYRPCNPFLYNRAYLFMFIGYTIFINTWIVGTRNYLIWIIEQIIKTLNDDIVVGRYFAVSYVFSPILKNVVDFCDYFSPRLCWHDYCRSTTTLNHTFRRIIRRW